jgi:TatD DNase family protein
MLIDTHAHVSDAAFNKDRPEVLARARAAGVRAFVDVGIDLATSRRALAFAAQHDDIYAAIGVHPHEGDSVDDATIAELRDLARGNAAKVVAVGETGLDFYRNRSSREGQTRGLRAQLDLARELDLPVILHLRSSANAGEGAMDAYEGALAVLKESGRGLTGVSHCFSGTPALARALVDLGFYVSFAGNSTYPNAGVLREAAKEVPLDRIVVETDCPYLTPQKWRGQRNEPAYVASTAEALARVRGMGLNEFGEAVSENARRLFRLKKS